MEEEVADCRIGHRHWERYFLEHAEDRYTTADQVISLCRQIKTENSRIVQQIFQNIVEASTESHDIKHTVLYRLISSRCTFDFRVLYSAGLVEAARSIRRQRDPIKRQLLLALHPRVRAIHNCKIGSLDALLLRQILKTAGLV